MNLDPAACYRAVLARDPRYDGRFFTCVKTTRIFCRPICPARPPKLQNCIFLPTAAAASEVGFRPCLRCRPESSPALDAWRGTEATVSRALRLIESGALDAASITSLARHLHIGQRQLRRLFRQHVGAAPVTVAQTRRLLLAKQLIHQTDLPMTHIALASGFRSIRRFNETFQRLYHRPPSDLRRSKAAPTPSPEISLLLPYRPPYDWSSLLNFFRARAIPGLEHITDSSYSRTIHLHKTTGSFTISHTPDQNALRAVVRFPRLRDLSLIIARIRRMFDLAADPIAINAVLAADPLLAPLIAARPGLRVPGGWDPFEVAVRAILGQQVSVKAATTLASRLVAALGPKVPATPALPTLTHAFPQPERFTPAALAPLPITRPRAAALANLAATVAADPHLFDPHPDLDQTIAHLCTLPGIGNWTAHYIALRALNEPDAFLAADVGLQRAFPQPPDMPRPSPSQLLLHAHRWRPWRAYAALHLWTSESTTQLPTQEPPHALTA
ncbi:MAG TPA: AlkA N-terminal domain-containing protein [Phycisphaerae bacterium]|nr:AlkA N-terminal domain-containing protein [Phycisphaerae bacterium]